MAFKTVEQERAYQRAYRQRNAERLRQYDKERWPARREQWLAWYNGPYNEKRKENNRRSYRKNRLQRLGMMRARYEATGRMWDKVSRREVLIRDGYRCWICNEPIPPSTKEPRLRGTVDHVIPRYAGGANDYPNCRAAHMMCNAGKREKIYTGGLW